MKVELNDIGTDVEIHWDVNAKETDRLYLNTTMAKYTFKGERYSSGSFYMTMPVESAEKLLAQLNEIVGKVEA